MLGNMLGQKKWSCDRRTCRIGDDGLSYPVSTNVCLISSVVVLCVYIRVYFPHMGFSWANDVGLIYGISN